MGAVDTMPKSFPLAAAVHRQNSPSDLIEYALGARSVRNRGCPTERRLTEIGQVDAFAEYAFEGNPAAVVLLPGPKKEKWMQQIATEFNVSQTAFLIRKQSASLERSGQEDEVGNLNGANAAHHSEPKTVEEDNEYHIRWFTPTVEVDLCGHATMASAHVLFSAGITRGNTIIFNCKLGKLTVRRIEVDPVHEEAKKLPRQLLELNFPIISTTPCDASEVNPLKATLKDVEVISVARSAKDDLIVEISSREAVEALQPNWQELLKCRGRGVFVTAKDSSSSEIDFVSRAFFPMVGVNEDPVCGSAHCALTPYWAAKLGKDSLEAYQVAGMGIVLLAASIDFTYSDDNRTYSFLLKPRYREQTFILCSILRHPNEEED